MATVLAVSRNKAGESNFAFLVRGAHVACPCERSVDASDPGTIGLHLVDLPHRTVYCTRSGCRGISHCAWMRDVFSEMKDACGTRLMDRCTTLNQLKHILNELGGVTEDVHDLLCETTNEEKGSSRLGLEPEWYHLVVPKPVPLFSPDVQVPIEDEWLTLRCNIKMRGMPTLSTDEVHV